MFHFGRFWHSVGGGFDAGPAGYEFVVGLGVFGKAYAFAKGVEAIGELADGFGFATEGGELVRLVEHYEIPASGAELLLQFFVARHLVEANDKVIDVFKRITARGGCFQVFCKDAELQTELLEHFLAPLIDQAAGGDDDNAPCVGVRRVGPS